LTEVEIETKGVRIIADAKVSEQVSREWFSPRWWQARAAVQQQLGGRGQALLIETAVGRLVLRRLQRGGLAALLSHNQYLNLGFAQSRAVREFRLLGQLRQRGLPVPEPIAASHEPAGLFYRAGLLTRLIPDARELAELAPGLSQEQWHELASTLERFFSAGLQHPDLNARNLLLDVHGRWHLLDFDRARLIDGKVDSRFMRRRLARSLEKLCPPGWRDGFAAALGLDS
jgi:3-deoxy-D-manno-octulosonic acid kinase